LIDRFPIPKEWPRYWSVDFDFTNPFVFQCWAQDPDGRLYRYREVYRAQKLVEDHARHILELTKDEPRPQAIICDHDAEGRATLERHLRMNTEAARKDITAGIQAVAGRLKVAGDGKPRIFLLRDSLVERCPHCEEKKLPLCLEDELPGYRWNVDAGRKKGEEPIDKDNHACDCLRYCISHFDLAPYKTIQAW
jgi:phage terminase large subunit